jgi:hypothetical protein
VIATAEYGSLRMGGANVTDWLTAIGTVGTLAATVALFWLDRRRRWEKELRAQSELISSWALHETDKPGPYEGIRANRSDEPVYNVLAILENAVGGDTDFFKIHQSYVDRKFAERRPGFSFTSLLPPKTDQRFRFHKINENPHPTDRRPRVYLLFNDRNGVQWARDFNGTLIKH